MSTFLIAAIILTLIVLALLLRPLLRTRPASPSTPETDSPALRILREQGAALDAELAAGQIDAAAYAESRDELARRVLAESTATEPVHSSAPRRGWAMATGACVVLAAVGLYLVLGQPAALDPAVRAPAAAGITPMQMEAMVAKLAAKVAANPDDLEGLYMLGRSYMVLERFQDASEAFAKLSAKQPTDAQALADWADALASATGKLAGEPEKLVAKALKLAPDNVKALALGGSIAFDKKDYKQAAALWEKMLAKVDPQSDIGQSAQAMLAEARARAGLPVTEAAPQAPAAASGLSARGRISLASKFKGQFDPAAPLFIFARPAAGGPPLAALRFKAGDLPLDFDFSQTPLMLAGGALPEKIIIGARISKSGIATPGPGDLQGLSAVLAPNAQGIQLEISEEIGK